MENLVVESSEEDASEEFFYYEKNRWYFKIRHINADTKKSYYYQSYGYDTYAELMDQYAIFKNKQLVSNSIDNNAASNVIVESTPECEITTLVTVGTNQIEASWYEISY